MVSFHFNIPIYCFYTTKFGRKRHDYTPGCETPSVWCETHSRPVEYRAVYVPLNPVPRNTVFWRPVQFRSISITSRIFPCPAIPCVLRPANSRPVQSRDSSIASKLSSSESWWFNSVRYRTVVKESLPISRPQYLNLVTQNPVQCSAVFLLPVHFGAVQCSDISIPCKLSCCMVPSRSAPNLGQSASSCPVPGNSCAGSIPRDPSTRQKKMRRRKSWHFLYARSGTLQHQCRKTPIALTRPTQIVTRTSTYSRTVNIRFTWGATKTVRLLVWTYYY